MKLTKGQMNLIGSIIGVMVLIIIAYVVVLPIVNTALYGSSAASANLSGGAYTLSQQLPLFIVLGIVITILAGLVLVHGI